MRIWSRRQTRPSAIITLHPINGNYLVHVSFFKFYHRIRTEFISLKKLVRTYIGRDMKSQRAFRKLGFLAVAMSFLFCILQSRSWASMVAPTIVSISDVITYLNYITAEPSKHKLTQDEEITLRFAQIGKDALNLKYLCSFCFRRDLRKDLTSYKMAPAETGLDKISATSVAENLTNAIQLDPKWELKLAPSSVAFLKKNRAIFEKGFGSQSYGWAWVVFQMGETAKARQILMDDFNTQYALTMESEENYSASWEDPPLTLEGFEQQALEKLCDKKQNKEIADRLQKMKAHLSNLPELMILTMNDR
jgi:hypothetical protein